MSVIVTGMDMPSKCHYCGLKLRGTCPRLIKSVSVLQRARLEDCPLKSIDGLIERIEQTKLYKGKSGNPYIDAYGVGLDRYFDLGLDRAIKIIKEYCEVNV